ncbi:MAG: 2-oxoglutarate dehydrogenase complex dihydrolipoyllysine-residue succinyltransferase [Phycisphaerae bacterium]
MPVELKIPAAGESITRVQIGAWLKQEGEAVRQDETLVEIETDKATMELPAPVAGVITRVIKKEGDSAQVGDVIGYMEAGVAAAEGGKTSGDGKPAAPSAVSAKPAAQSANRAAASAAAPSGADASGSPPRVMPAAARELAESGFRAEEVKATGPGGRLLKEDVLRHAEQQGVSTQARAGSAPSSPVTPPPAVSGVTPSTSSPQPTEVGPIGIAPGERVERVVPMTPLRQKIAERLVAAKESAALLTTFNEIDMSAVMALRKQYAEAFQQRHGVKLGFMSFFVRAATDALRRIPEVNAAIRDVPDAQGRPQPCIVYHDYCDIGVAVSGGKGLVVPVLRSAEMLSFAQIELAIADFGARARDNKIKLEELAGGTFTISNGGVFGSLMSTPIVNPPQVAILGLHAIQDRPVAREGQVVVRPMMYVALTYDHRIIDGREAVTFLKRIKESIEDPARLMLEV